LEHRIKLSRGSRQGAENVKKAVAFVVAFVLFLGTAVGCHFWSDNRLSFHNPKFGTWISEKKFYSHEAITANLNKDSIVVFGSSELNHMRKTKYHPERMFAGQKLNLMMMGSGYYQSFSHAIELSAIEPGMKNRKVVLILAPQWFRPTGVLPDAFASRFSEDNYIAMLQNDKLSGETKKQMIKRTEALLVNDPSTLKRIKLYERIFWKHDAVLKDEIYYKMYSGFLKERTKLSVVTQAYMKGFERSPEIKEVQKSIDWETYLKDAEKDGKKHTSSNHFYIKDVYYKWNLGPQLKVRKNSGVNSSYCRSPEYGDLRIFLESCRELKIEPLIINVPVNGWWYDYTGFPKKDRQQYYENIRAIAKEYGAKVADHSGEEYTPYFLEDTMHLGWKGWVYVNEDIYNFANENQQQ